MWNVLRHVPGARCARVASAYHSLFDFLANCSISTQSSSAHAEERVSTGVESGELLWRLLSVLLSVNVFHLFKSLIVTFISVQILTQETAASAYHSLFDFLANCSISTQSSSAHAEERVSTGVESGELLWRLLSVLLSVNVFTCSNLW